MLTGLLTSLGGVARAGDVAVVAHPDVAVEDLSFAELRKIMLGDRQFWSPGHKVVVLVRKSAAPERKILLDKIYRMNEAQYRKYWVAKLFRAEATDEPKAVLSNLEAMELVGVIPGAIALIDANDIPPGVNVLSVDGTRPGDADYPLR